MTADPRKHVKMSITLPPDVAAQVAAAVEAGEADNASAYIARRLSDAAARERTHAQIMALRGGRPLPAEAIEWACRTLGATPEQTAAMHAELGELSGRAAS